MTGVQKRLLIPIIVAFLAAGLTVTSAMAQTSQPVSASMSVESSEPITVGDPIDLSVSVTHPSDLEVIFPQLESAWADFVVREQFPPTTVDNGDGTETTSQRIDVRLFTPGAYTTPPMTVTVTDVSGQVSQVEVNPVPVNISSVLVDGDTELRDIKPQADLPYVNFLPWITVGFFIALIGLASIWIIRRRRARLALAAVDNRLPHEVALDELTRIDKLNLPEQGRFKEHYTLISDCMRIYVEKRYGLPMIERTTSEIQVSLKQSAMPGHNAGQYLALLDVSDLVKFSKYTPDVANAKGLLAAAREVVQATKPLIDPDELEMTGGTNGKVNLRTSQQSTVLKKSFVVEPKLNGKVQHTEVRS